MSNVLRVTNVMSFLKQFGNKNEVARKSQHRLRRSLQLAAMAVVLSTLGLVVKSGELHAAPQKTVLNVLAPPGRLDARVVAEFEQKMNISVRVEFVGNDSEYESRLRSSPHLWDVLIANEQRLITLSLAKLTRSVPDTKAPGAPRLPLEKRSSVNEDGKAYVPLMADPLGLVWIAGSRKELGPVSWKWLVNPDLNPLFRSRVLLPADTGLQFLLGAFNSGVNAPYSEARAAKPAFEWVLRARHQQVVMGVAPEYDFLGGRAAVGAVWQSEFLRLRKLVTGLTFAVPAQGTFFDRHGVALVADTPNEALALDFMSFLNTKRDESAARLGFVTLITQDIGGSNTTSWQFIGHHLPLPLVIENELKKMVLRP